MKYLSFNFEPASLSEVIRQGILMLVLFGIVNWTDQQIAAVLMFVSGVLTLLTRAKSVPVGTIENAGTTPTQLKAQAETNVAAGTTPTQMKVKAEERAEAREARAEAKEKEQDRNN